MTTRDPQEAPEVLNALAEAVSRRELAEAARVAYRALEEDERLRFFLDIAEEILGTRGLARAGLSTRKAPEPNRDFPKPLKYGKAEIERVAALATLEMTDTQIAAELGIAISVVRRLKATPASRAIRLVKQDDAPPAATAPTQEADPKHSLPAGNERGRSTQVEEPSEDAGACNHALPKEVSLQRQELPDNLICLVDRDGKPVAPVPAPVSTVPAEAAASVPAAATVSVPAVATVSVPVTSPVPSRVTPVPVLQSARESTEVSKRPHLCGRCNQRGHNTRTCPTPVESTSTTTRTREREPPRNARLPKKGTSSSEDNSEIYFKQIRTRALLTKDDELALAKRLEETETASWRLLLEAPEAPTVIARVCEVFADRVAAAEERAKPPDFTSSAEVLAAALRYLDHERVYIAAVLGTVPLSAAIAGQVRALQREASIARERFITSNLRLVISMAKKWISSGVPLADLIQEGNLGLMHAVQRYDHRRGFRFSTYATWWIRHELSRFIQEKSRAVRVPVHLQEARGKVNKQRKILTTALGREPTLEELSEATQLPRAKLEALANVGAALRGTASLDATAHAGSDSDGPSLLDQLTDPEPAVTEELIDEESRRRVTAALASLPEREKLVILKRFGIGDTAEETLGEIGDAWGLSRERIRQLEQQALTNLRRTLTTAAL